MGNLIAEAVRSQTGSDIAMLDIESVQNGIKEGDVTLAKIYAIHPWRNRLLMFELTGEQIQRALSEKDAIVSGFSYTKSNGKVDSIKIGEASIEMTKIYKVVMDEFLWAYIPSLSNVSFSDTGERVDTILIKYFENMKKSL